VEVKTGVIVIGDGIYVANYDVTYKVITAVGTGTTYVDGTLAGTDVAEIMAKVEPTWI
jgi:hypothetical protein